MVITYVIVLHVFFAIVQLALLYYLSHTAKNALEHTNNIKII